MARFSSFSVSHSRTRRQRRRWWVLALLLLVVLIGWGLPEKIAYHPRWQQLPPAFSALTTTRDAFYRAEDPIRRLFTWYTAPDTLPVLRFALPDSAAVRWFANLDSVRARGINAAASRRRVGATLHIGRQGTAAPAAPPLTAAIGWHGKFRNHWAYQQRSLKVKLADGGKWWGLRSFNLLTADNRDGPGLLVAAQLARAAGIWHPRERLVRVEINGDDWGIYYAEEPIDDDFLVRRGVRGGVLLAPRATWADDFADHRRAPAYGQFVGFNRASHVHALALEPAFQDVEAPSDSVAAVALGRWAQLRDLVRTPDAGRVDSAAVGAVFDVAAWGAADALRHLLADRHNLAGDNLNVVFDPATGLFRPIYRFEGGLTAAARAYGLTNAPTFGYNHGPLPLWAFVNTQPTLRLAKLRRLHRLTATPAAVEDALRRAADATDLLVHAPGSNQPIRQRRWVAAGFAANLRANRALIDQSLSADTWLYATGRWHPIRRQLEVVLLPEAEGALMVRAVEVQTAAGNVTRSVPARALLARPGALEPGGPLGLVPVADTLYLTWPGPRPVAIKVVADNMLTGKVLPAKRVRVAWLAPDRAPRP